jgi:hypothetical protein
VKGVDQWMGTKLNLIWDRAKQQIQSVADKFHWLWDVVVGHSYVPDMVDAIGANMARLDALMVEPAKKGTDTTAGHFRDLARDVGDALDALFPKTARLREEMARLIALQNDTTLTPEVRAKALDRQTGVVLDARDAARAEMSTTIPDVAPLAGALDDAYAAVAMAGADASRGLVAANDNMAKSFVDMANTSLNALSNLASAIKGGGVLDIMSSAFNAFGSIANSGILGKGLAKSFANFTPISGFRANGGPVSAGRSYVVGERGPEMFTPSRSGYVHANGSDTGRGGTVRIEMAEGALFRPVVTKIAGGVSVQTVAGAAPAISGGTQKAITRANSRKLA